MRLCTPTKLERKHLLNYSHINIVILFCLNRTFSRLGHFFNHFLAKFMATLLIIQLININYDLSTCESNGRGEIFYVSFTYKGLRRSNTNSASMKYAGR